MYTAKQLRGYYKAKKDWIGINDNYNLATFGITQAQYAHIRKVEQDIFGICQGNDRLSLRQINY